MATKRLNFDDSRCRLMGMVHLRPLLQDSEWPLDRVEALAVADALTLAQSGFDAIVLENFGDSPFYPRRVPAHTVAAMTRIGSRIRSVLPAEMALGINVLRNDGESALAIAAAVPGDFVRVNVHSGTMITDQGIVEGQSHQTVRYRDQVTPGTLIFADIRVKHAAPLVARPLREEAEELAHRARADAIIISGAATGSALDLDELSALRSALPAHPLLAGSGVSPEQLPRLLPLLNGLIVGTYLKRDGQLWNPIDPSRAERLVRAVRSSES